MRYELKKNLAGAYSVKFKCPKCGIKLSESLKNAGQQDTCPECGQKLVIPGAEELSRQREEQDRIAAEKAERKDAEREEKKRVRQLRKRQELQAQHIREQMQQQRLEEVQARLMPNMPKTTSTDSDLPKYETSLSVSLPRLLQLIFDPSNPKIGGLNIGIVFVGLIFASCSGILLLSASDEMSASEVESVAVDHVLTQLQFPSTATFSNIRVRRFKDRVIGRDAYKWFIGGDVRSKSESGLTTKSFWGMNLLDLPGDKVEVFNFYLERYPALHKHL